MRVLRVGLPIVLGLCALTVYLLTLYPGQGGGGDSAKFQYLGSVLGTAHPPGYPLYLMISYAFSHVPIGTLAYRMNLLSACLATAAGMLVYLILVRERCHMVVAFAAALALAFDRYFWSKALGAEVYSLNAALLALVMWQALRWARLGRQPGLYLTASIFGLSLGNHLTAAMLAPGLVLFVIVTRPAMLSLRPAIICVLLGVVGLSQYAYILIRTWQHAAFVEARAS